MTTPNCRTCGSMQVKFLGNLPNTYWFAGRPIDQVLPGGGLWRCRDCQFVFRYPLLGDAVYQDLYERGGLDVWDSESKRQDFSLIRNRLIASSGKKLAVLDVGCYTGQLLTSLPKSFDIFGIEPNKQAAEVASRRGVTIIPQSDGHEDTAEKFDVIIACDVIEHVPNPLQLLRDLGAMLKSNGIMLVSTGNADSWLWRLTGARFWYCYFPEHISFIGERWLNSMPARAGLELIAVDRFNYRGKRISILRIAAAPLFWASPATYTKLKGILSKAHEPVVTPGNGATMDHMLCVFKST